MGWADDESHPVTGEEVPDPEDQVKIYRVFESSTCGVAGGGLYSIKSSVYWKFADMRELFWAMDMQRTSEESFIQKCSETVDYVMYWWHKAASCHLQTDAHRKISALITTNTVFDSQDSLEV